MKKKIFLLLIFVFCLIPFTNVFAKDAGVVVTKIEEIEKSANVVVHGDPSFENMQVNSNVDFFDVGDYIKYRLTFKNSDDMNYYIDNIVDNNANQNIKYEYEVSNPLLEANGEATVVLKVSYASFLSSENALDSTDTFATTNRVDMRVNLSDKPKSLINPGTANNFMLMLFFIAFFGVSSYIFVKYKNKKVATFLLLIAFISIPVFVKATEVNFANVQFSTDLKFKFSFLSSGWKGYITQPYTKISIVKTAEIPESAVDVSKLQDGSIKAWVDNDTLIIGSKHRVFAPVDSSSLFSVASLQNIEFNDNFDTGYVTNMSGMFRGCVGLTTLDLSSFDTNKVVDFNGTIGGCPNLTEVNLEGFNFSGFAVDDLLLMKVFDGVATNLKKLNLENVKFGTSLQNGFVNFVNLEELNLHNVDTSNVTNMKGMFIADSSLKTLDLSSFDTSEVTDMSTAFSGCSSLNTVNLSSFDTRKVTDMSGMFLGCGSLKELNLKNFNFDLVESSGGMFENAASRESGFIMKVKDETDQAFILATGGVPTDWDATNVIVEE